MTHFVPLFVRVAGERLIAFQIIEAGEQMVARAHTFVVFWSFCRAARAESCVCNWAHARCCRVCGVMAVKIVSILLVVNVCIVVVATGGSGGMSGWSSQGANQGYFVFVND